MQQAAEGAQPDFHILRNLFLPNPDVVSKLDHLEWQEFQPGVRRHLIYQDKSTQCLAVLLKYDPGASVPEHIHTGNEHVIILKGSQHDRLGTNGAGTLIVNRTGTRHSIVSEEGCVVLVIYEKPVSFGV